MPSHKGETAAVVEFRRQFQQPTTLENSIQFYLLKRWSAIAASHENDADQLIHDAAVQQCDSLLAEITAGQLDPIFTWGKESEFDVYWRSKTDLYGSDPAAWDTWDWQAGRNDHSLFGRFVNPSHD